MGKQLKRKSIRIRIRSKTGIRCVISLSPVPMKKFPKTRKRSGRAEKRERTMNILGAIEKKASQRVK